MALRTPVRTSGPARPRAPQLAGLVLLALGVASTVTSFRTLHWYSVSGGTDSAGDGFTFGDLHANADQLSAPVAAAYFDKLAWGFVALAVLIGLAAKLASPLAAGLQVLGFLAGFLGLAMTYYALAQLFDAQRAAGGSDHTVLHSSSYGLWTALAGFVLLAFGAAVGPPAPVRR